MTAEVIESIPDRTRELSARTHPTYAPTTRSPYPMIIDGQKVRTGREI
jgi:hypothetical protein